MYNKLIYAFDIAIGFIMLYMILLASLIQTEVPITPCFFVFDCILFFYLVIVYFNVPLKLYRRNIAV